MPDFLQLPNSKTAVERVRPRKAQLWDWIADAHALHFTDGCIARMLNMDRGKVRDILTDMGLVKRWSDPVDALSDMPERMRAIHSTIVGVLS